MVLKEKELIKYFKSLGIDVHTSTKARGYQGFYLKNRIDISKNIPSERIVPTLLHEFAHYVHSKIEPFMGKTGGSIEALFDTSETAVYTEELLKVTHFVDKHSKCEKLLEHKKIIKEKILVYEKIIKQRYPNFMRSKKFKEFDKYIKKSDAKYLLKYDRIKLISGVFFKKTKVYTIDNIEHDFPEMPIEFAAYIRLRSCQKRQSRIASKINKLNKYYNKPTELFARFIEGLYLDSVTIQRLAPNTYNKFYDLLTSGYYKELAGVSRFFYNPVNL